MSEDSAAGADQVRHWMEGIVETCRAATPREVLRDPTRLGALGPRLARMVQDDQAGVIRWLREPSRAETVVAPRAHGPAEWIEAQIVRWLYRHHPFLSLSEIDAAGLKRTAAELVARIERTLGSTLDAAALGRALSTDLEAFQAALALLLEARPLGRSAEAISAEYSPELQVAVLGLELSRLKEPILDLGCGEEAWLVRYLRAHGKAAVGTDRHLETEEGAREADWFYLPLVPASWGTVIAHQSFTLHFLHHHLGAEREAERYARRYMEILQALSSGGSFYYAPGLPFLEPLLPRERYRVTRRELAVEVIDRALLERWVSLLGENPLYACRVERSES